MGITYMTSPAKHDIGLHSVDAQVFLRETKSIRGLLHNLDRGA